LVLRHVVVLVFFFSRRFHLTVYLRLYFLFYILFPFSLLFNH
jgi:hypothetical protein